MKLSIFTTIALLFCLSCGGQKERDGDDAARESAFEPWTHFRGNASLDGVNPNAVSDTLKLLWTFRAGKACVSSPVTDGENVYIGSYDNNLYALNVNTGNLVWKFKAIGEIEASPVIYGDVILIGDLGGYFYSVSKKNGAANWQFKAHDKIAGAANVVSEKNLVIFGSYDDTLYCLNIDDGQPIWKYGSKSYINGTPATDGEKIVFGGCDAGAHIVDVDDGKIIGKIDTESYIAGSAVLKNNFAYIGSYGKKLLGIDIAGMKISWIYENDGRKEPFIASPALIDTLLIATGRDKFVHCVSSVTGNLIWKFPAKGAIDASPVICKNKVVVGCNAGWLYLLDLKTGTLLNSYDMGGPLGGTPLVFGKMVIVGDENGIISALKGGAI